ncbi:type 1 fimbrial protein [Salmonella enterica subsp. enterica serovar Carswell]|nr:type 1 fimbrial protein [Salmonella enterica]
MNKVAKSFAAGLLALSATSAWATDGTIEFTGKILNSTCQFANGDTINIELGHYAAAQFKTIGDQSPIIPVDIPLKNCPVAMWQHVNGKTDNSFQVWLETRNGGTVPGNDDLIAVTGMDTAATGVGIRIDRASSGEQMGINKLSDPQISFTPKSDGTAVIDLQAYYVSTAASSAITPGEANATVDVTIDYR